MKLAYSEFQWARMGIEIDLRLIEEYVKRLKSALENELGEFERMVEEEASKITPQQREDWYEWTSNDRPPQNILHSIFSLPLCPLQFLSSWLTADR